MAVRILEEATEMSSRKHRETFLDFLKDYGTHYVTEMVFGSKVSHTQKYSDYTTQRVGKETLEECTTK